MAHPGHTTVTPPQNEEDSKLYPLLQGSRNIIRTLTPTYLGFSESLAFPHFVVDSSSSSAPDGFLSTYHRPADSHPHFSVILGNTLTSKLRGISSESAEQLVKNYLQRILPIYPIVEVKDITEYYEMLYVQKPATLQASVNASFNFCLIMAISMLSLAKNTNNYATTSMALFNAVAQYSSTTCTNDIEGLQSLLLILLYANLNPNVANIWYIVGIATRTALDFGLHREVPVSFELDTELVMLRRRLFWVMFEINVSICVAFLRPIGLFHGAYRIEYPDPPRPQNNLPKLIWQFRELQSSTYCVLFNNHAIDVSIEVWMEGINRKLDEWHSRASQLYPSSTWHFLALNIARFGLYRPSPTIRHPNVTNTLNLMEAVRVILSTYSNDMDDDDMPRRYSWHILHLIFDTGIHLLYCISYRKQLLLQYYDIEQLKILLHTALKCLGKMTQCCNASNRFSDVFQAYFKTVFHELDKEFDSDYSTSTPDALLSIAMAPKAGALRLLHTDPQPSFEVQSINDLRLAPDLGEVMPENYVETIFGIKM